MTLQDNVDTIKANTCRTVAVSGLLVAIAFFAGILLPERNLQGTCVSLGFAVLASVATNVLVLPAVFLCFGPLLVGSSFLPTWWGDVELAGHLADEEEQRGVRGENGNWLTIMRAADPYVVELLTSGSMASGSHRKREINRNLYGNLIEIISHARCSGTSSALGHCPGALLAVARALRR